ncbi:MAG: response regulator transcription factor [Paracoccaceae bacterium]|nr:MAG: response regulator transcription factor [Paracoccaceae bacterium]
MTISFVLCDDHVLFREALAGLLQQRPGYRIVGHAGNGIEAIAQIKRHQPDIAILDLSMPGVGGAEVFAEARRWSPATRYIVLTGTTQASLLRQLDLAGISGLVLKSASSDDLCAAVAAVARGGRWIAPETRELLGRSGEVPRLSAREIEVLHAIARGLSNPGIAEALGISPKTVDNHRSSLMTKLGVRSTATLLVAAIRAGLVELDPRDPRVP